MRMPIGGRCIDTTKLCSATSSRLLESEPGQANRTMRNELRSLFSTSQLSTVSSALFPSPTLGTVALSPSLGSRRVFVTVGRAADDTLSLILQDG